MASTTDPHLADAPLAAWRRQCECRMPAPGMLRRGRARPPASMLASSVMIGDKPSDIAAGRAAGLAACIRIDAAATVDTVAGGLEAEPGPDFTCESLGRGCRLAARDGSASDRPDGAPRPAGRRPPRGFE
jgi:histidinol phosphatase-like enzyme